MNPYHNHHQRSYLSRISGFEDSSTEEQELNWPACMRYTDQISMFQTRKQEKNKIENTQKNPVKKV